MEMGTPTAFTLGHTFPSLDGIFNGKYLISLRQKSCRQHSQCSIFLCLKRIPLYKDTSRTAQSPLAVCSSVQWGTALQASEMGTDLEFIVSPASAISLHIQKSWQIHGTSKIQAEKRTCSGKRDYRTTESQNGLIWKGL